MKKILLLLAILALSSGFSWEKLHSIDGKCEIQFPTKPQHMEKVVPIYELNSYMKYDVYLSALEEKEIVYMMVIAHYPTKIEESKQLSSLEGFINGILNHKEEKKLIYASFSEYDNKNSLDFLVENQNRLFKGKAIIFQDRLYLIAMEYNQDEVVDKDFEKYLNSFNFSK